MWVAMSPWLPGDGHSKSRSRCTLVSGSEYLRWGHRFEIHGPRVAALVSGGCKRNSLTTEMPNAQTTLWSGMPLCLPNAQLYTYECICHSHALEHISFTRSRALAHTCASPTFSAHRNCAHTHTQTRLSTPCCDARHLLLPLTHIPHMRAHG